MLLNGTTWDNFEDGRLLRQYDPLSPYLFIMVAKVLRRSFTMLVGLGSLKGIMLATTLTLEAIQQFVDDTFFSENPLSRKPGLGGPSSPIMRISQVKKLT